MRTSDFDYPLPEELIATVPAEPRDASRLMTLDRGTGRIEHRRFSDLPELLRPGDCLVVNESRVIPARLTGRREPGATPVEMLLVERIGPGRWRALARPGRRLQAGARVRIEGSDGQPAGEVHIEAVEPGGERIVRLETPLPDNVFLERYGRPPLPPYIEAARRRRASAAVGALRAEPAQGSGRLLGLDRERYQTVYARVEGSVAAPTAGLHFTEALLAALEGQGVEIKRLMLHVGPGTFAPVRTEDPARHRLKPEWFEIAPETARAIAAAAADPARRVIAVGTTVVRTLETCGLRHGGVVPCAGWADLMILPGFRFRVIQGLVTNFHLPRSTLLMLVSAFAGREVMLRAYAEAVAERYRFYSYGDAMLIV